MKLSTSPNGQLLACKHVPQNYDTTDYHDLLFRQAGDTYVEVGAFLESPPERHGSQSLMRRLDCVPLDEGGCLVLETDDSTVYLARYESSAGRVAEAARWIVDAALSLSHATLRLLPSGREALVIITDRDDSRRIGGAGRRRTTSRRGG
ncbi:MAG TPA: hypothetical protein VGS22_03170 [Thermoanaerobaculia bacterium]|nr:hypothetical protein [Thermoanaerobaculia bacterium]